MPSEISVIFLTWSGQWFTFLHYPVVQCLYCIKWLTDHRNTYRWQHSTAMWWPGATAEHHEDGEQGHANKVKHSNTNYNHSVAIIQVNMCLPAPPVNNWRILLE